MSGRKRLFQNLAYLRTKLRAAGWAVPETPGPIVRLSPMNAAQIRELKKRLLAAGIYPPFTTYPGAPARGAFRFVISSEHRRAHLKQLAAVLAAFQCRRAQSKPLRNSWRRRAAGNLRVVGQSRKAEKATRRRFHAFAKISQS